MDPPPASPEIIIIDDDDDEPIQPIFEADSMDIKFYDPIRKKITLLRNRPVKHMLPKEVEIYEEEFRKRGCDPKHYMHYDKKVAATKDDGKSDVKEVEPAQRMGEHVVVDKEHLRAQTNSIKKEVAEIRNLEKKTRMSTRRLKEHAVTRSQSKQYSDTLSKRLNKLKTMKKLSEFGLGVPEFTRVTTDKLVVSHQEDPTERKWKEAVNASRVDAFKYPWMWYAPECFFQESGPRTVPQPVEPVPAMIALFEKNRLDPNKSFAELDQPSKVEMRNLYSGLRNLSKRQSHRGHIVLKSRQEENVVEEEEE